MHDNQEMLSKLGDLVAINSVAWVDPTPQAPYGSGPAAALDYMLRLCDQLGFRTTNCDGRVGWAEIGQGDEMVGILCHLDVVPAGEGWNYPPFALTLENGRAYGRGGRLGGHGLLHRPRGAARLRHHSRRRLPRHLRRKGHFVH